MKRNSRRSSAGNKRKGGRKNKALLEVKPLVIETAPIEAVSGLSGRSPLSSNL